MELSCEHHTNRPSAARCVECGRHLCQTCRVRAGGRSYCGSCVPETLRRRLPGTRSPRLAAMLSVVPGLGQLYAGAGFRSLVLLGLALALAGKPDVVPPTILAFLWVFNLRDAFVLAKERNAGLLGERLDAATRREQVFWGLLGAATGVVAIAQATVVPQLTSDVLWPVALVLYGGHLITDRRTPEVSRA